MWVISVPTRCPHELSRSLVVATFFVILLIDASQGVGWIWCLLTVQDPITLAITCKRLLLVSLYGARGLEIHHLNVAARSTGLVLGLQQHTVLIDLPDDLVHADDALDVLFSLVLCSLWIILAPLLAPIVEFVEIVVSIWISSPLVRHKETWAKLLLVIQDDDLEG